MSQYDERFKPHKSGRIVSAAVYRMHVAGIPEQDLSNLLMHTLADPRMRVWPARGATQITFTKTAELMLEHASRLWPGEPGHADIVRRELQAAELIG